MPQNTTSGSLPIASDSNGLNIRPELMPESFFFLDKSINFTQTQSEKFGIIGTSPNTTFRTTSRVSFSGSAKLYTICAGQILIQPHTDNSKVNVILKPFKQPIQGLAIKYFIYRGLNKSDFFDSNGIINANTAGATGFVDYIRNEFKSFYETLNLPEPAFTAQHIGYPSTVQGEEQDPDDLIDDYFFKISQAVNNNGTITEPAKIAYELPIIPRGTYLGNATGQVGLDVVLNEGDYSIENDPNPFKLNLAYARLTEHVLDSNSGGTLFKNKLIKESATQFIDIAAFYGLHTHGKGKLYAIQNGQVSILQSNDDIYEVIKTFYTAKTTYLYIQGSRQRSYNFYENYYLENSTSNIKIGTTVSNLTEEKFETDWPLREFSDLSSLVLQLTTDSNDSAAMYVKQGILNISTVNEDYFIRGNNLLQQTDENNTIDTRFTKPIAFDFTKTTGNNSISSFIQLIYEGKALEITNVIPPLDPPQTLYLKDIDDIFGLINVTPHIQPKNSNELRYVIDQNLLLVDFENNAGGKDIATVTTKRVEDQIMKNESESLKRVTYETLLNNIRQNVGTFFQSRSAYQDNSNMGTATYDNKRNNFYQPEKPYYLNTETFTNIDGYTITGLTLHTIDDGLPSKKVLGIIDTENTVFNNIINQNALNNPKFYFKEILQDNFTDYISSEGFKYKRYNLCIMGESQEGELTIICPTDKMYVSTIDNLVYVSDDYAKYTPLNSSKEIIFNLNLF